MRPAIDPRPHDPIVILGAGYAGVMAANRLRHLIGPQWDIVIVSPRAAFVERIRLHEFVASGASAEVPLESVLADGIRIIRAECTDVNAEHHRITLDIDGTRSQLSYTYVVIAVGSGAPDRHGFASLSDLESADELERTIRGLPDKADVTVIGGGATGVEFAAELAERCPRLLVTLLTAGPLVPTVSEAARRRVQHELTRLGVRVEEGVRVISSADGCLELSDGRTIRAGVAVSTMSFTVPALAARSGLPVDRQGRLLVDEYLRSIQHPRILGAGDAVSLPPERQAQLRMACATALPMGVRVAETIAAELSRTPARPFSNRYIGLSLSLGRRRGVIQLTDGNGKPARTVYIGWLGAVIKERVSRYALESLRREALRGGSYRWRQGWEASATVDDYEHSSRGRRA